MEDTQTYAVFLYPKAVETLGEAITPYLQDAKGSPHVLCREVDTGGALIEMTLDARTTSGDPVQMKLMVPTGMVLMIVTARSDASFGFGPRMPVPAEQLPPVGQAGPKSE